MTTIWRSRRVLKSSSRLSLPIASAKTQGLSRGKYRRQTINLIGNTGPFGPLRDRNVGRVDQVVQQADCDRLGQNTQKIIDLEDRIQKIFRYRSQS